MSYARRKTSGSKKARKKRNLRPLAVVAYAALIGLLLAFYVEPLQQVFEARDRIPEIEQDLAASRDYNDRQRQMIEGLQTREGIERAARERYGMIKPGEKVYIVGD